MSTKEKKQIVVHIDLDCFYCQVEQNRLGIGTEIPCAVQQWNGLIAVNYAARSMGVTRFMRVVEAKQRCPQLHLLHVETIGKEGRSGDLGNVPFNAKETQKASLDRYRRASEEIIRVVRDQVPEAQMEKASIDEVYLDLTSLVEKEMMSSLDSNETKISEALKQSVVIGGPLNHTSEQHRSLLVGAAITLRIREAVLATLKYTCSAGIAHNKQLAKMTSAKNKPNKQTIVLEEGIDEVMIDMPLKKIPMLGGKLGTLLETELDCQTAGDVQRVPFHVLSLLLGRDKAEWVAKAVKGIHEEEVKPKKQSKSMTSAKRFTATTNMNRLEEWIEILSVDLADRITKEMIIHNRLPRNLTLSWHCGYIDKKSRVCHLPKFGKEGLDVKELSAAGIAAVHEMRITEPCSMLALTFSNFTERPKEGRQCILSYLGEESALVEHSHTERPQEQVNVGETKADGEEICDLDDVDIEEQRKILQSIELAAKSKQIKGRKTKPKNQQIARKKRRQQTVYEMLCKE